MLVYFLETLEDESDKDYIIWLYNEFERLMYSTAFKYTTIPQIAEDIVQVNTPPSDGHFDRTGQTA